MDMQGRVISLAKPLFLLYWDQEYLRITYSCCRDQYKRKKARAAGSLVNQTAFVRIY